MAALIVAPAALGFATESGDVAVRPPDRADPDALVNRTGGAGDDLDPWVNENGDDMTGDLRMHDSGIVFDGGELRSTELGELTFHLREVCFIDDGCGGVREVRAGAGLAGGPITSEGTLRIADGGVDEEMLAFDPTTQDEFDAYVPSWSLLSGVPSGFADGVDDDTTYTPGTGLVLAGTEFSADTTILQSRIEGACAGGSAIRSIDAAGGVECEVDDGTYTDGMARAAIEGVGYALLDDLAAVASTGEFEDLLGIPTGLLDGDDDTLGDLECADGEIAKTQAGAWGCGDDIDTDGDALRDLACAADEIPKWDGSAWACAADLVGPAGSNADTLDGLDSMQFLRSDTDDTFEGVLTVASSLRVGGASSPLTQGNDLHILSPAAGNEDADILLETGHNGKRWYMTAADTGAFVITHDTPGGPVGRRLTIEPAGNIGIGTADPLSDLHIVGNSAGPDDASLLHLQSTDTVSEIQFQNSQAQNGYVLYRGTNLELYANSPETPTMTLTGGSPGKVGVGTTAPDEKLHVAGNVKADSFITASDRTAKDRIQPVDARSVLDRVLSLPINLWSWKADTEGVRHMGPMAQDFAAAFGLGATETGIATVDADGVALAAIQGLHDLIEEKDARIDELEARLVVLEQVVAQLSNDESPASP